MIVLCFKILLLVETAILHLEVTSYGFHKPNSVIDFGENKKTNKRYRSFHQTPAIRRRTGNYLGSCLVRWYEIIIIIIITVRNGVNIIQWYEYLSLKYPGWMFIMIGAISIKQNRRLIFLRKMEFKYIYIMLLF